MTYIYWAFILGILANPISWITNTYLKYDLSFIVTLGVLALIIKGLSTLDKNQKNFQTAKIFSMILVGVALVNGLMIFVESTSLSGGASLILMGSGIISILNEYHIVKGIQSYANVLSNPKETVRLLKYWKINLIASIVFGVSIVVSAFAIGVSYALAIGVNTVVDVNMMFDDPEFLLETLRPMAPILIVLLVIVAVTIMITMITRILWYVTMYHIQKDHQQVLKAQALSSVVE
jgi:hypothetical protein